MPTYTSESDPHLDWITCAAASVDLVDATQGVLGELIDPAIVWQGIRLSGHDLNVGRLDDPQAALATQAMHSFTCADQTEIQIELDNATSHPVTVRWMDEQGHAYMNGTIEPFSSMVRYSRLGHLFVLTAVMGFDMKNEHLIGAYRIRRKCPSGSPHQLLLEENTTSNSIVGVTHFRVEALIADPTGHDELVIAAAGLDTAGAGQRQVALTKTIKTLSTIVSNLLAHPDDPKFQSLRISNQKVQSTLLSIGAARQMLYCIGFREQKEEDHWTWKPNSNPHAITARLEQASQLLDILAIRAAPGFVPELAAIPPWQGPILASSHNTSTRAFGTGHTNFLSDDEKWDRADRNRQRRGRSGRRPDPGNAPSSNGAWGR